MPAAMAAQPGRGRPRAQRAYALLRRGKARKEAFVSAYGQASTPAERLVVAFAAVRATLPKPEAVAPETARRLDRIADDLADLFVELHAAQEVAAQKAVRTKQRQAARNQVRADQRRAAETAALAAGGER